MTIMSNFAEQTKTSKHDIFWPRHPMVIFSLQGRGCSSWRDSWDCALRTGVRTIYLNGKL